MLEKTIEAKCVKYAKSLGLYQNKIGLCGWPDRVFLRKDGAHLYIEFKQKGKKLRPLQEAICNELKTYNCKVYTVDNFEDGKKILDEFYTNTK